jgi:molybdate transport system permease protein
MQRDIFRAATITTALGILLFYLFLVFSMSYFFRFQELRALWTSERAWAALRLSLLAATLAASLALLLAIPAAYALSRFSFRGRAWVDAFLEFPLIVSPAALGAILLIFFNTPLGAWLQKHTLSFVFGFAGVVLAQWVTVLGIATRLIKTSFDAIPPDYERVARTLGASPLQAFLTTTLPIARGGLLSAFVLSWAKAMGEFGATITLAGTMPFKTETLPIAISLRLGNAQIEETVALILLLLLFGIGALALIRWLQTPQARAD